VRLHLRVLVVSAIAVLAGCSGAGIAVPKTEPLARAATIATPDPLIFVGMSVNGQSGVGEFHRSAGGNVKPVRTMAFTDILVSLFGADSSNNFWAFFRKRNTYGDPVYYAVHYSSRFTSLGTLSVNGMLSAAVDSKGNTYTYAFASTIVEYAAGSYGKKTLRQINLPCCIESTPQLATDGSRNLYASAYPSADNLSQLNIAEWGRKSSGNAPPKRTIPMGTAAPSEILADSAGDLYMTFGANVYSFSDGIWKLPAESATPQWFLPGLPVKAFALDAAGNVYAEVPTIENNFAVEIFSPAGSPIATIAGTKTRLGYPSGITVTP
jgi:hypothetical protein